ncbi:hypothetical protein X801_01599, partial [Opisthorchis viverrini]
MCCRREMSSKVYDSSDLYIQPYSDDICESRNLVINNGSADFIRSNYLFDNASFETRPSKKIGSLFNVGGRKNGVRSTVVWGKTNSQ